MQQIDEILYNILQAMANLSEKQMKKHISTLRINKMRGRMLHLPAPKDKKREILLIYGHHASIERMFGISANLNRYGSVTTPDLPGFGGMDSFYKIGLEPSIDNYADYLASVIKLRFKRKKITIVAMSFAFPIVTRMLQKYPEIARKVNLLVSFVGFIHNEDFRMPMWQQRGLRVMGRVFQRRLTSSMMRYSMLTGPIIRSTYTLVRGRHSKMKDALDKAVLDERIEAEIRLWQINDVRTRMHTMAGMFSVDVCDRKVDLSVHHVSVPEDRYFDNNVVEQHMRIVYNDFKRYETTVQGHMPSIVATSDEADPFIPPKLKRLLARKPA